MVLGAACERTTTALTSERATATPLWGSESEPSDRALADGRERTDRLRQGRFWSTSVIPNAVLPFRTSSKEMMKG